MKQFKININTKSQKYQIIIGKGLCSNLHKLMDNNSIFFNKCLIVIDNKIENKIIAKVLSKFKKKKKNCLFFQSK